MEFKARASAAGKLMVMPRSKSETISETAKTYLQEWLKEKIYGLKKEISNKFIEKGNDCEDEAIDFAIDVLNLPFALKNEKYFENEYFTGTPDLIISDTVIDIKNSWDCWTFPLFENECPNRDYFAQLQVYMNLTGLKKAKLVYVLMNTPETWNSLEIDYSHVPSKYRVKSFDIDYNPEFIETLKEKVVEARKYIKTIML